jgi:hypothetical protein
MGKIFLNHTGKLPFHDITTSSETSRDYYYSFYPQKFLHFDKLNNDIVNGYYLFYKAGSKQVTGELPNLIDGRYMFYQAKKLEYVNLKTPNLADGRYMFNYCENLKDLTLDTSKITRGYGMFRGVPIKDLTNNTKYDYSSLTNGEYMFANTPTEHVTNSFDSLLQADSMFYGCDKLESVTSALENVVDTNYMFYNCKNLNSVSATPNVETAHYMFYGCESLTEYHHDLSKVYNSSYMFQGCKNLRVFTSPLVALGTGTTAYPCRSMFDGCKLNKASVLHVINQLKNITPGISNPEICIGADKDVMLNETDRNEILSNFTEVLEDYGSNTLTCSLPVGEKEWSVLIQCN